MNRTLTGIIFLIVSVIFPYTNSLAQINAKSVKIKGANYKWSVSVKKGNYKLVFPIENWELNKKNSKGGKDNPRYFYFEDYYQNMVVSGWLQPDTAYHNLDNHWSKVKAWLASYNVPEPSEVEIKKIGDWDCVLFDVPVNGGVISNIYANHVVDGEWIDLRISMTTSMSNTYARTEALKQLKKFSIEPMKPLKEKK